MPVRPSVRYCIRFLLRLRARGGERPSDAVPSIEAEHYSGTIRNDFPESKRRSVVTENTAPTGVDSAGSVGPGAPERTPRRLRADAQRNIDSLLEAAKAVFAASRVDAPARSEEHTS